MTRIQEGRSYVSEGRSHLIDLIVDGVELGTKDSEVHSAGPRRVKVTARATAYLSPEQDEIGRLIAARPPTEQSYWDIERARIADSRTVPVELLINGEGVATREIEADGEWVDIEFEAFVERSSWIALRVLGSSHTNPLFVVVDRQPIRVSRRSAQWCREAVDRCWLMKSPQIRETELEAARAACNRAREVYDDIVRTSPPGS